MEQEQKSSRVLASWNELAHVQYKQIETSRLRKSHVAKFMKLSLPEVDTPSRKSDFNHWALQSNSEWSYRVK